MNLLGIDLSSEENEVDDSNELENKKQNEENTNNKQHETINKKQVENLLLSSRELFLEKQKNDFIKAPISQKLFGMGYAGNYTDEPKMVEMDFYDLLFSFGIIGTLILLIPLLYFGIKIIIFAFLNIKIVFNLKYSMYATSLLLAFGIAFTAGHVLTAPAVSIYIAAILGFLTINFQKRDQY